MADVVTSNHTPSVNRTNLTACERCRRRKKKCDGRLPQCRLCQSAGAECVGFDAVSRRQVPRSYILSLEQRIVYLEACLAGQHDAGDNSQPLRSPPEAVRQQDQSPGRLNEPGTSGMDEDSSHHGTQFNEATLPAASATVISDVPSFASLQLVGFAQPNIIHDLDSSRLSLPTWQASQNLVRSYFQFANLSQPILYEPHFRQMVSRLYSLPRDIDLETTHDLTEIKIDLFFVLEVFAIALLVLQKHERSKMHTSVADRYHRVALQALTSVGVPTSILGVQALLLASQYFYHHPVDWEVWKSVGAAVRLAVEIGLHEEPDQQHQMDYVTLDIRRRTFWVAYAMDRNLAIALGKPTALADGAISVQFPSALEDDFIKPEGPHRPAGYPPGPKSVNIHLLRFRQIQSEMQTVLRQSTPPGHSVVDIASWRSAMHQRIRSWYDEIPQTTNPSTYERRVIENFDLTYKRALLYLYQPANEQADQEEAAALIIADAVTHIIALYRKFFDERRLTIYWQAIENLAAAGTALLYSYLRFVAVQQQVSRAQLQSHVQMCSSLLWAMVEHFPAFRAKRDIFDTTAARIMASLPASMSNAQNPANVDMLAQGSNHFLQCNNRIDAGVAENLDNTLSKAFSAEQAGQQLANSDADLDITTPSYADFESAAFDWDAIGTVDDDVFASWL